MAKAATTGRRELEQQARKRRPVAPVALLGFDAVAQPVADPPTTISLRADGVRLAWFEALLEKAHKPGLAAVGGGEVRPAAGPAAQIIVQQCPDRERAAVTTSRGEKRVAPAQLAALTCDARVQREGRPNRATIPPSVRAAVLARDRYRCAATGCGATRFLEVHHMVARSKGGSNRAENLTTLCSRCHGFAHESAGSLAPAQPDVSPRSSAVMVSDHDTRHGRSFSTNVSSIFWAE